MPAAGAIIMLYINLCYGGISKFLSTCVVIIAAAGASGGVAINDLSKYDMSIRKKHIVGP